MASMQPQQFIEFMHDPGAALEMPKVANGAVLDVISLYI